MALVVQVHIVKTVNPRFLVSCQDSVSLILSPPCLHSERQQADPSETTFLSS